MKMNNRLLRSKENKENSTMLHQNLHLSSLKSRPVDCGGQLISAPLFLAEAFDIIRINVKNVGIFRTAGQVKRVKQLKGSFFNGCIPTDTPVNDVCDAVKAFFRDLDEPLLTSGLQDQFLRFASTISREDVRVRSILQMCRVLTPRHRETLAFLMWQLKLIADHSADNKMDISNLATVLSMSIFRSESSVRGGQLDESKRDAVLKASVFELLIKNADSLCGLAKHSEMTPREVAVRRMAVTTRKHRMNTIVGTCDLPPQIGSKIDSVRRRSAGSDVSVVNALTEQDDENQPPTPKPAPSVNAQFAPDPGAVLRTPRQRHRKVHTSLIKTVDTEKNTSNKVSIKVKRSVSDAAGQQAVMENEPRRRSIGGQAKIKRGQPNTVCTGLDKAKLLTRRNSEGVVKDLSINIDASDLTESVLNALTTTQEEEPKPALQTLSAESLQLEQEEENDGFDDFERRKLELVSSKKGPPSCHLFRSPTAPARDRPSIAFIRHCNRGRVQQQAAMFENTFKQQSTITFRQKPMEKKPAVPTFTQVAGTSRMRSPARKFQPNMPTNGGNATWKL